MSPDGLIEQDLVRAGIFKGPRLAVRVHHGRLKGELTPLTPRELEVLQLAGDGYGYKQIACELGITYQTMRGVVARLREKLDAVDKAHAVAIGFRMGLLK